MSKYLFLFLFFFTSCSYKTYKQIEDYDIQGKWYIKEIIDLKTKEKFNVSFIQCPYFDLKQDKQFYYENGFNTGGDKAIWKLQDSSIVIIDGNPTIIDTIILKIVYNEKDCMCLQVEKLEFILSRFCKENRFK